jgi:hypothetical protein
VGTDKENVKHQYWRIFDKGYGEIGYLNPLQFRIANKGRKDVLNTNGRFIREIILKDKEKFLNAIYQFKCSMCSDKVFSADSSFSVKVEVIRKFINGPIFPMLKFVR